ncbi:YciI family protein [Pseudomonas cavernicola]|uniref:YciI family protein n=1 Tax=Pseudomonas cavernicola TaxID=2320866 RepID=A0A418XHW0_9PSED|nr:YciI family protein [Pseudomonas cavernicola]RJG12058.1 YciI family protein [Pseudomonas cavernicola]
MKYLCLIYIEEKKLGAMTTDDYNAVVDECLTYEERLQKSGHFIAAQALQPIETATTLRLQNGKLSITDGPFAETKEQLAGFYLIDAKDLNEAIQVAAKIPPGRLGCVEVRPIKELTQS